MSISVNIAIPRARIYLEHIEGEPSIYRLVGKHVEQQRADEAFLVIEEVREFVAHMRFYGLMEEMGYQPRRWFDEHMRRLLSVGPLKEIRHPFQQPLVVARVILEAGDKALASELLSYFPESVVLGKELAALVGSHTVVEIADRLLRDHGTRLEFVRHEERPRDKSSIGSLWFGLPQRRAKVFGRLRQS